MSPSLCQSITECNQPLLLESYSGLICDVILAKDLQKLPVEWQPFCPQMLYSNLN